MSLERGPSDLSRSRGATIPTPPPPPSQSLNDEYKSQTTIRATTNPSNKTIPTNSDPNHAHTDDSEILEKKTLNRKTSNTCPYHHQ